MDIKETPGRKGKGDMIVLVRTNGWEAITIEEFLTIYKLKKDNEDRLYRKPRFKGGDKLHEIITDVHYGMDIPDALIKHKVPGANRAA